MKERKHSHLFLLLYGIFYVAVTTVIAVLAGSIGYIIVAIIIFLLTIGILICLILDKRSNRKSTESERNPYIAFSYLATAISITTMTITVFLFIFL